MQKLWYSCTFPGASIRCRRCRCCRRSCCNRSLPCRRRPGTRPARRKPRLVHPVVDDRHAPGIEAEHGDAFGGARGGGFLDRIGKLFGNISLVPPHVLTLYQFIRHLSASLTGATLMDESSRLVLLEGVVKGLMSGESAFGKNPDVFAPALSAAVADMIEQLTSAGVSAERLSEAVAESDFPDKASVRLLTRAFRRYEDLLAAKGLVDPDGLLSLITESFDTALLSPYSRIVIDGLPDAGRLQSLLLGKIAAHDGCTVLVEAPSPESVKQAGPYHPLRLTREFLEDMGFAPGAASPGMTADDLYVSGTIFSDRPFAATRACTPGPMWAPSGMASWWVNRRPARRQPTVPVRRRR